MIDPLINAVIALAFAAMFAASFMHKASDRAQFLEILRAYQVLPAPTVAPAAYVVMATELPLAISWLVPATRMIAVWGTMILLLAYTSAIAINLYRGRVHVDCGCGFGSGAVTFLSGRLLVRNMLLVAVCSATLLPTLVRDLGLSDFLALAAALPLVTLLYAGANQLLANRAAIDVWRKI